MSGPVASPEVMLDVWTDVLLHGLRGRITVFGELIGKGQFEQPTALDHLMDGPVLKAARFNPTLFEAWDEIEAEIGDRLFAVANEVEQAHDRARRASQPGPVAHYPPATEPRNEALARLRTIISGIVAEGARIGAARRELRRRRDAEMPFLAHPTPQAKAALTRQLNREVAAEFGFTGRIPTAPRTLVTGAQAVGKTALTIEALAAIRERIAVRFGLPTIAKCHEAFADYTAVAGPDSLTPFIVRGRAQPDPTRSGEEVAMCRRHATAKEVSERGLSVGLLMCGNCPFASDCGYLEQQRKIDAMQGVGLFLMASEGLFTASPAPAADLFVGDERIDPTEVKRLPLAALDPDLVPLGASQADVTTAQATMKAVAAALAQPHQLAALRAAGVDRAAVRSLVRLLKPAAEPDASGITGTRTDDEIVRALDALPDNQAGQALAVLRAILREMDRPRPMLNGVALDRKRPDLVVVSRLRRVLGISDAAVLLLDGSGDPTLNRAAFGARLRHEVVRIERDAFVTGTEGKSYSRQSLTALDMYRLPMPNRQKEAARLRDQVAAIAARMPGPCFVAAAMAAETALVSHLPEGAPTGHFGALRGKNLWEQCLSAVVVGQTSLPMGDLEDEARCYLADDAAPFETADVPVFDDDGLPVRGWPYHEVRQRRMRGGGLQPVTVPVHPDRRVQRVLEQVREAEVVQAIDRPRPVFNRRDLVLMNSLCLDCTYDRILSHSDLVAGGTRWHRAWEALGILPLGARDLHRLHPGLFPTPSSARDALRSDGFQAWLQAAGFNGGPGQTGDLFGPDPHYRYRVQGQRGPRKSRVLIDLRRHPDPRTALAALLDPLPWFEAENPEQDSAYPAASPAPVAPILAVQPPPAPPRRPVPVPILVPGLAYGPPLAALPALVDDEDDALWPIGPPGWPSVGSAWSA